MDEGGRLDVEMTGDNILHDQSLWTVWAQLKVYDWGTVRV